MPWLQPAGRRPDLAGPGRMRPRLRVFEPCQQAALEFLWACADGAAVVGFGDLPQVGTWGVGVNLLRVADGDVAVYGAVDQ